MLPPAVLQNGTAWAAHSMLICSLMAASHSVVKVRLSTKEPLAPPLPPPPPPSVLAVDASTGATSGWVRLGGLVHTRLLAVTPFDRGQARQQAALLQALRWRR